MDEGPRLTDDQLAALRALDTPTVCNAIERIAPDRQGAGFTIAPFVCARPDYGAMVGYARTATIRAMQPSTRTADVDTDTRLGYYAHVSATPGPTIAVIEDLDPVPGFGAFWGEVNTNVHKGLGAAGVITNGSIRDLTDCADGFQLLAGVVGPSHAWVRVEDFGLRVSVHGMTVEPDDLIHADRHGAVVVPIDVAPDVPAAAADIAATERIIIEASQQPGFDVDRLNEILRDRTGH